MTTEEWHEPGKALDQLRRWAERHTTETIDWYLRDKKVKRWASRLLRAATVILAVAGGLAPLLARDPGNANAGYVLLALAAGCVAFDHFFGLSSGWMRDITTAQALQSRLATFHLRWAAWQASEAGLLKPDPFADDISGAQRALDLINDLMTDVLNLTELETAQWITHFNSSIAALRRHANPPGAAESPVSTEPTTTAAVTRQPPPHQTPP